MTKYPIYFSIKKYANHEGNASSRYTRTGEGWYEKEAQHFKVYSCYNLPTNNPDLTGIQIPSKTILTGDCNAHSTIWGYNDTNQIGRTFEESVNSTTMEVVYNRKDIYYWGTGKNPNIIVE